MTKKIALIFSLFFVVFTSVLNAQITGGFKAGGPREFEVGGITVEGLESLDENAIVLLSGIKIGQVIKVPGDAIPSAIKNLWKQQLFEDVQIEATKIIGKTIFLNLVVKERPRLSKFKLTGVSKSEADKIREDIDLYSGKQLTENVILETRNKVRGFFIDKGFWNVEVKIQEQVDTIISRGVILTIDVKKNKKVKINEIHIVGNEEILANKLKRSMKDTKEKNFFNPFKTSKYLVSNFNTDKSNLIHKYRSEGFRNARILSDSVVKVDDKNIDIYLTVHEGEKFYFRNISWAGNTKHTSGFLDTVLSIKKGDVYNQDVLMERLQMNMSGYDVSSLYMDNGYLTFQANPVEVLIENDSIDIEIRMYEGKQFRIGRIFIRGNEKTNDHVILREIRTLPGELFNRNEIIRTQRELAQLGFFNAEKFQINPIQHPEDGTVDIEYVVQEQSTDQVELSAGFGGGFVVGTVGLAFNNFSIQNMFKPEAWKPLPTGDGQKLALRMSATGLNNQNYTLSFTEPWLGGKKPTSFTTSIFHSVLSNGQREITGNRQAMYTTGVSFGFGQRLTWPDDYFSLYSEVAFQRFDLDNYSGIFDFSDGYSNNISVLFRLSRNSIDQPLYPRNGSNITLSIMFTPPYSLFDGVSNDGYANLTSQEKYKWSEYYKWKFTSEWFTPLSKDQKLVLRAKIGFGGLGYYNSNIGFSPFERFVLGGSGLSGSFQTFYYGREIIALRGYDEGQVSYDGGSPIVAKYTLELRYPASLNPNATVYFLGFAEAGNSWETYEDFNPFNVMRAAGLGVRVFLPMFGMLGLDYGWGFDSLQKFGVNNQIGSGQFHFTLGMNIGEL